MWQRGGKSPGGLGYVRRINVKDCNGNPQEKNEGN